jgi:hypothetical protein
MGFEALEDMFMHRSHVAEDRPKLGIPQPALGIRSEISFRTVGKKSPLDEELDQVRKTLAANLAAFLRQKFPHSPNRPLAIQRYPRVKKSTVSRYLDPATKQSPGLDKLVCIAHALGIKVHELLMDAASAREAKDLERPPTGGTPSEVPARDLKSRRD